MKEKIFFAFKMGLLMLTVVLMCVYSNPVVAGSKKCSSQKTTKVQLSSKKNQKARQITLKKGCSIKLKVDVKAVFRSANKKIASVSSNGVVKGNKEGKTKITVCCKKNKKRKAAIILAVTADKKPARHDSSEVSENDNTVAQTASPTVPPSSTPLSTSEPRIIATSTPGPKKLPELPAKTYATDSYSGNFGGTPVYSIPDNFVFFAARVLSSQKVEFRNSGGANDKLNITSKDQIQIWTSTTETGSYDKQLTISDYENNNRGYDNVYEVTLDEASTLVDNQEIYLEITLPDKQIITATMKYVEYYQKRNSDRIYVGSVGSVFKARFQYGSDYTEASISGLPGGLTSRFEDGIMYIDGTPIDAGASKSTVIVTDAEGESYYEEVTFLIGSDTKVVAAVSDSKLTFREDTRVDNMIYICGGSGKYTCKTVWSPGNCLKLVENHVATNKPHVTGTITSPGTYSINLRVSDNENSALTADFGTTIVVP